MKKGFSLIEILILTFIFLSLLILIIGVLSNSREFGRTMGCVSNMKNIAQAIDMYQGDFKDTPVNLISLMPQYIQNFNIFHCLSDREKGDSYSKFYIGRYFASDDSNKVFLICPRHFGGKKIVAAYLSYAVDIGKSQKVFWSGIPAEFGKTYSDGQLKFVDGTIVNISGDIGLLGSFTNIDGKIYNIIYSPEGANTNYSIEHKGDSEFEVVTPAVIAGVEGTKFNVTNSWGINSNNIIVAITVINVEEGIVKVRERNQGRVEKLENKEELRVETKIYSKPERDKIPRKPPKERPHIVKKEKVDS
ncbi:MAG: FecR family protein [Candidatus Omnitrophica bacterium]|nr:FecR family protein [Candidatus Omnitrophota bacterium]